MPDYKKLIRKKPRAKRSTSPVNRTRFSGKLFFFLLLSALLLTALFKIYPSLSKIFDLSVSEVSVINQLGKRVSNPDDFFRLDLSERDNLLNVDLQRITRDIQARHPELKRVSIYKQFPHRLVIVVKERQPIAVITARVDYLVDQEGVVLPFKSVPAYLPKIIGIARSQVELYEQSRSLSLKKCLNLLKELKQANVYSEYKISQIDARDYSGIVLFLENGIEVKMGEGDFRKKAILLKKISGQLRASNALPKYIDMRFDDPCVSY